MRGLILVAAAAALVGCSSDVAPQTPERGTYAPLIEADAERPAKEVSDGWTDYTGTAFAQAQADGRTIVADVYADWCPTCMAQEPILDEIAAADALDDAIFFKVDFDRDKDFVKAHRIPRQSTILKFENGAEVERSIAETDRDRLRTTLLGDAA